MTYRTRLYCLLGVMAALLGCNSPAVPDATLAPQSTKNSAGYAYGHDQGNGADNYDPTQMIAWFQGDRTIRYCADVSPAFGLSESAVVDTLASAFAQWRSYLIDRKINEYLKVQAELWYRNGLNYLGMATESEYVGCDGTEDLKFYFGSTSTEVETVKTQFYNPWSFAYRSKFDPAQRWNAGFIWVAAQGAVFPAERLPDWGLENRLKGLLLHEIGHVYGNIHIQRTVMRSDFTYQMSPASEGVSVNAAWRTWTLGSIDAENELYMRPLSEHAWSYAGTLQPKCRSLLPQGPEDDTFYALTGRHSQGVISAHMDGFILSLSDGLGTVPLTIEIGDQSENIQRSGFDNIFSASQFDNIQASNPSGDWVSAFLYHYGSVSLGLLHGLDGTLYPISWMRNGPRSPLQVTALIHGIQQSIFADDVPYEEDSCI